MDIVYLHFLDINELVMASDGVEIINMLHIRFFLFFILFKGEGGVRGPELST